MQRLYVGERYWEIGPAVACDLDFARYFDLRRNTRFIGERARVRRYI